MAIDRGGLRYEIDVVVRNLRALRAFRTELRATTRLNRQTSAQQVQNARRSAQVAEANERIRRSVIKTRIEETRLATARERLRQATNATLSSQARYAAAVARTAAAQARAAATARAQATSTTSAGRAGRRGARGVDRFRRSTDRAARSANRASFTFRRLFGILFAFQAARLGIQGFQGLVRSGVQFNDQIENARIGIAGLISATGLLRRGQEPLLRGAEAYAGALEVAEGTVNRIRTRALETTATTTELLDAVQIAIGPGLSAGLDLSEVEDIAVLISQAATALRVPQNQLGEEIRSVLSGTTRQQTTRLVAAFGTNAANLNESIRQARDAGRLFDFLRDRLTPFAAAASEAANTFSGLQQRVRDAVGLAAGGAAVGLFDELKITLREIFDILTDDSGDFIEANADAAAVLFPIMDGIRGAVQDVREQLLEVSFEEAIVTAQALGQAIRTLALVAVGFFRGVVQGITLFATGVRQFQQGIDDIDGSKLTEILVTLTAVATVAVGLRLTFGLISVALGPVLRILRQAAIVARVFAVTLVRGLAVIVPLLARMSLFLARIVLRAAAFLAKFLLIPALVAGVLAIFKLIVDRLTDTELKLVSIARILKESVTTGAKVAGQAILVFFSQVALVITRLVINTFNFMLGQVEFVLRKIAAGLDLLPFASGDAVRRAAGVLAGTQSTLEAVLARGEQNVQEQVDKLRRLQKEFTDSIAGILQQDRNAPGIAELIENAISNAVSSLRDSLPEGVQDAFENAGVGLKDLLQEVAEGGIDALDNLRDKIKGIIDGDAVDVDALVASIRKALEKGAEKAAESQIKVLRAIEDTSGILLSPSRILNIEERVARLRELNRTREIGATRARIEALEAEQRILRERQALAVEPFDNAIEGLRARQPEFEPDSQEGKLLTAQINELLEQRNLIAEEFNLRLVDTQALLQRLGSGGFADGFIAGMQDIIDNFDEFELAFDVAQQAVDSFVDNLFSVLEGTKSVGEALQDFFRGLAETILKELLRLQIAKLLVSAGAGGGHEGGLVRAEGFHDGGNVAGPHSHRPRGLHPADTVPAWLQPGEYVQPVKAVAAYGADVMEAIRQRMIHPGILRMLATGGANLPRPRLGALGMREGGSVTSVRTTGRRAPSTNIRINSREVVDDGLSGDTLRVVSPGIKQPRNVAEQKGMF